MLPNKQTKRNLAILLIAAALLGVTAAAWADHKEGHNPGGGKPGGGDGGGGGKEARYTLVHLGTLGSWTNGAMSINKSGQVVGDSSYADSYPSRAFLVTPEDSDNDGVPDTWFRDDGEGRNALMIDLGTLGLGNPSYVPTSIAVGINDLGQVLGRSVTDDYVEVNDGYFIYIERTFLITPETDDDGNLVWFRDTEPEDGINDLMIDLGIMGGDWSTELSFVTGYGINNSGHVVGYVSKTDNVIDGHAFVIAPEDSDGDGVPDTWFRDLDGDGFNDLMIDLGTLGGGSSQAHAVNDLGQVVGDAFTLEGRDRGFLITPEYDSDGNPVVWFRDDGDGSNALMIELGPLSGADTYSRARAVNVSGQVVGVSPDNSGSPHAVLWEVDELGNVMLTDLGKVQGKQSTFVNSINDAGQAVGDGYSYGNHSRTAVLWENENGTMTMTKLIDLIANSKGNGDLSANCINESGMIVGTVYGDGYHHAYIALPITSP